LYLWHIPLVATVTGIALAFSFSSPPLSALWWGAHVLGLALIASGGWWLAGRAGRADRVLLAWADRGAKPGPNSGAVARTWPIVVACGVLPVLLLNVSVTGFGTWWGEGVVAQVSGGRLSLPFSSLANCVLLVLAWVVASRGDGGGRSSGADRRGQPGSDAHA
jgi:hypothetical protein